MVVYETGCNNEFLPFLIATIVASFVSDKSDESCDFVCVIAQYDPLENG